MEAEIVYISSVNYSGIRFALAHKYELASGEFEVPAAQVDPDIRAEAVEWLRD